MDKDSIVMYLFCGKIQGQKKELKFRKECWFVAAWLPGNTHEHQQGHTAIVRSQFPLLHREERWNHVTDIFTHYAYKTKK